MQFKFDKNAQENDIFVIGSLGFDSVPSEVGVQYTIAQFPGLINEIEAFIHIPPKV